MQEWPEAAPRPPAVSSARSSSLQVFEIVARRNPRRPAERRVVEVDPRAGTRAIRQEHVCLLAPVQAAIDVVFPVAFDLVERREHPRGVGGLIDLAPDVPIGCW